MLRPYAIKLAITILGFMSISMFSDAELVHQLPGQPQVSFKQYAGYITVGKKNDRALFYYFVEAEQNPSSKPLVLWLNGGPGCSSIGVGAFSENGPFQPRGNVLVRNDYSWNKEANILYLETPAGVGFSYSNTTSFYNGVNDKITAHDNLVFLLRWLNKFPAYKTRDLYLTGESYAGHYVPQLAVLMLQFNQKHKIFNLKGIAIGNPLLNFEKDFNARAEYLWSHGLISDNTYKSMANICNYSRYVHEFYAGKLSGACENVNAMVDAEVSKFISSYDVTLDVCLSSIDLQSIFLTSKTENKNPDVCVEDESETYLNRRDVQTALNVDITAGVLSWDTCSSKVHYDHQNLEISTVPLLGQLVKAGVRVFVYSGDQDSVIPLTSTRTLVYNVAIDLKLNSSAPYRVWFEGKQVGGWTQDYGIDLLTFATVRGASHEVPFSQPERSLVLFKSFIDGKPSGHACHIWDASTEELVFNGGDITDPDALRGWRMLTEQAERIGRVRIGSNGLLLLATRLKVAAFDLETHGIFFRVEEEADDEIIVESVDVNRDRVLVASNDGNARVRRMRTLENICALPFDGLGGADDNSSGSNNNNNSRKILGTLNTWLAFVCIDGVVHAWDADSGARLYRLVEQVGDVFDLVSDDEHVAGCAVDNGIHLWSFRP